MTYQLLLFLFYSSRLLTKVLLQTHQHSSISMYLATNPPQQVFQGEERKETLRIFKGKTKKVLNNQ